MKLLLDTYLLLWLADDSPRLKPAHRAYLADPDHELLFSSASIWEIAIKRMARRRDFDVDPRLLRRSLLEEAFVELPITSEHCLAVAELPLIHKDSFDRLMLAQAKAEGILFVTADEVLVRYPVTLKLI
ncbi:MAG TPA: type II toxin-antitoxin system VapC family toxin [Sphingomonas sp.]|nr:type II toxin-antitoxin system VapC family toxin [Sphingomonas sp.]